MLALLRTFSWQDLRHHPWRSLAAVIAVMLGVALAFAVHVINASALDEFSQAVRAVNGQPDLELRAMQGHLDEALYGRLATHPQVARASPVLELSAVAAPAEASGAQAARVPLRVLGADALLLPAVAPALMPRPWAQADRFALFSPATVFLNAGGLQAARASMEAGLQAAQHAAATSAAKLAQVQQQGSAQQRQISSLQKEVVSANDRQVHSQAEVALTAHPG